VAKKPQIEILLTGDARRLKGTFNDAGKMTSALGLKFGGLMSQVGKLGVAFAGLYAAKRVAGYLGEAATAAMDDAKAMAVLHTAIGNLTGATEGQLKALDAYIEKTQLATGFTEEELRPAMTALTTSTRDVAESQDILAVAMDTATAREMSLETIALALSKARNGQTTALQRLGFATKDASGKTKDFATILADLNKAYGGATATAADTMAGKMKRLGLAFAEIKEALGYALLPTLEKLADWTLANMPKIEKAFADAAKRLIWFLEAPGKLEDSFKTAFDPRKWFTASEEFTTEQKRIIDLVAAYNRGELAAADFKRELEAPAKTRELWEKWSQDIFDLARRAKTAGEEVRGIGSGANWSEEQLTTFGDTVTKTLDGIFNYQAPTTGMPSIDAWLEETSGQLVEAKKYQGYVTELAQDYAGSFSQEVIQAAAGMGPRWMAALMQSDPEKIKKLRVGPLTRSSATSLTSWESRLPALLTRVPGALWVAVSTAAGEASGQRPGREFATPLTSTCRPRGQRRRGPG
jgi:hypothetical protein